MAQIMSNKEMKLLRMLKKDIKAASSSLHDLSRFEWKIKILAQEKN